MCIVNHSIMIQYDTIDAYVTQYPELKNVDSLTKLITGLCGGAYDASTIKNRVETIRHYQSKLDGLLKVSQCAQRSHEWYEMRRGRLTASSLAQAIGKSTRSPPAGLIRSKAFPELDKPFDSFCTPALRHGIILEEMTARCYQQRRNNIEIHNFGMIPHPTLSCFGASPDGINALGIMIEIKTPYSRKVGGAIPQDYYLQMQGQMAVCELEECDFVDAEISMDINIETYLNIVPLESKVDHGMIVEYFNKEGERLFMYSPSCLTPKECFTWAVATKKHLIEVFGVDKVQALLTWRLVKIHIERVHFDQGLWDSLVPKIQHFWDCVEEARVHGVDSIVCRGKTQRKKKTEEQDTGTYAFIEEDD